MKYSTQEIYCILAAKQLLPMLGDQKLCDLSRMHIQTFIGQKQREKCAPQTLAHFPNLLSKVFSTAMNWSWRGLNPAQNIGLTSYSNAFTLASHEAGAFRQALSKRRRDTAP